MEGAQDGRIAGVPQVGGDELTDSCGDPASPLRAQWGYRLLAEAAARLLEGGEVAPLVQVLLERFARHLDCDVTTHFEVDGDALRLMAATGLDEALLKAMERLPLGRQLCGVAAQLGTFLYLTEDELELHPQATALCSRGVRVYACTPLRYAGSTLGTLAFASRRRASFGADELELLRKLGQYVSAAMGRVRSERALRQGEARYRNFLDHATDALFLHDAEGRILDVNHQACEALGYAHGELVGRAVLDIDPLVTEAQIRDMIEILDGGGALAFESVHRHRDGTTFPVEVRIRPFWVEGQRFATSLVRNISERRKAEDRQRENEIRLAEAQEIGGIGSFEIDVESWAGTCSTALQKIFGFEDETPFRDFRAFLQRHVHPDDLPSLDHTRPALMREGGSDEIEFRFRHPTSGEKVLNVRRRAVRDRAGKVCKIQGTARDVTERRSAEQALLASEKALRAAQVMAQVGNWVCDVQQGTIEASDECCRITGMARGARPQGELFAHVHPEDLAKVQSSWQAARAGSRYQLDYRVVVEGETRWLSVWGLPELDAHGRVVRLTGVTQEITARRRLEEQLRQAQKMEALGRLAGGVAHDFNNLLTAIVGFGEELSERLAGRAEEHAFVEPILKAAERAAQLTHQLLAFSRTQVVELATVDLLAVVSGVESMLRRILGEDVQLALEAQVPLWPVRADSAQLEQVLMNLVANSRDSMPRGGRIAITLRNVELGEVEVAELNEGRPGRFVEMVVGDTGEGMTPEVQARMFDPFFTTKEVGRGTGLGLAMVYGVVSQSGGYVSVDSALGQGTRVRILLPVAAPESAPRAPAEECAPSRGAENVLVVEDDEWVRQIARSALEQRGFKVQVAADGAAALRLVAEHAAGFDLLLTDVVMPGMGGRQLADQLRQRSPALRVLFMSGYTDDAVLRHGVLQATDSFLKKPFSPAELVQRVRSVLDGGR